MEQTNEYKGKLVDYTNSEEVANTITHAIGILFAIIALIVMLLQSNNSLAVIASICFFLGMMITYTNSTIYHALTNKKWKVIWRKADHCSVCFIIWATGAPICLCTSGNLYNYIALGICFLISVSSAIMCLVNLQKFSKVALVLDFVIAAVLVSVFFVNFDFIEFKIRMLYLAGALSCLIGSFFFGRKKEYTHAIFHILELIGTIIIFFASLAIL